VIDGNTVQGSGENGIFIGATGNTVIRNISRQNTGTNYSFGFAGNYGPVLTDANPIATENPWANFGD
jgi:hypothetical protein